MEMLATTATGINKISMQIRRGGRAAGQRSGGVALVALMRIGHGAERPTEFTTRRRFVRTDASREITLVSPLAASGRRAAAMPWTSRLLAWCAVASGGISRTEP